uniref:hypothetical protein n=1 Tax=Thaumasiovibrio occultus TaxID=1891184 RepID=UPI000B357F52|nr:hypothetical protein [Thaumasiovibrio occultus]
MKNFIQRTVLVVCLGGLMACQSTPEVDSELQQQQSEMMANAATLYQHWHGTLKSLDLLQEYSPENAVVVRQLWQSAQSNYEEFDNAPARLVASPLFGSTSYYDRFLSDIEQIEHHYEEMEEARDRAMDVLAEPMDHLAYLRDLNARHYFRSEFDRLERRYFELLAALDEQGRNEASELADEFLLRAQSLEVKTIKRIYVTPLENRSRELLNLHSRSLIPVSQARVEAEIKAAKDLITATPRDFTAIDRMVSRITFELNHARQLLAEVNVLRELEKANYESYLLDREARLLRISEALSDKDYRDLPLDAQLDAVLADVEAHIATHTE